MKDFKDEEPAGEVLGYVIIHTRDHKRCGKTISNDYVTDAEAETKYNEVLSRVKFPEELICRRAMLKHHSSIGKYYTEE